MKVVGSGDTSNTAVSAITRTNNPKKETTVKPTRDCWNCERRHQFHQRASCPAFGKICNKCGEPYHFAAQCRSNTSGSHKSVKAIDDENSDEVFPTEISAVGVDDSQIVTVRLDSGNYLRFQVDTGAQCNVVPLQLYQQAAKDHKLAHVSVAKSRITAYGGTTLPVVGTVQLNVTRGSLNATLHCKIVDGINIRPLLGRESCLQLKIISYLDNDKVNKLDTGNSLVFALDITTALTREQLIKQYFKVLGPGVGLLEGKYCIRIDNTHQPVQHAPRCVLVAIRDNLKQILEHLTQQGIITPVTEPTDWISSMVVVTKKNGMLRICLDPKDLNRAIQQDHYPLPTIEDVAICLHGAKLFTVLDVKNGFWHVALDELSSYLTTFYTPFGRFRWNRMPFGICSAPEIFQRRMHQLIEGLQGVEVVADDFVVVGRGSKMEDASRDHDNNLKALLDRCAERGVKLNPEKVRLRMTEVPFIGHLATSKGLCMDPAKIQAISEMPTPNNVAAVQ